MLPEAPYALAIVFVAVAVLLAVQRTLSWREYQIAHRVKTLVCPALQPRVNVLLVSGKEYRGAEYLTTIDDSLKGVYGALVRAGGSPHLVCSIKERPLPDGGRQYSAAHVLWLHSDGSQTEAFLFHAPDGGVDVYAHTEPSVLEMEAHLDGRKQVDGDPRGVVWDVLADAYGTKEIR